jgi:hypothetical protein
MGLLVLLIGACKSYLIKRTHEIDTCDYLHPMGLWSFLLTVLSHRLYSTKPSGIGSSRYYRIQSALIHGNFPPARGLVTGISAALALVVSIVFGVLVAVPR